MDVLQELERGAGSDRMSGFLARHVVDEAPPDLDARMERIRRLPPVLGLLLAVAVSALLWWLMWRLGVSVLHRTSG